MDDQNLKSESAQSPPAAAPRRRWLATVGIALLAVGTLVGMNMLRSRSAASVPQERSGGVLEQSKRAADRLLHREPATVSPQEMPAETPLSADLPIETTIGSTVPAAPVEPASPAAAEPPSEDDRRRQKILGQWTRSYSGTWEMTIREDGTGTTTVRPDSIWALVVGPKVTIDMTWKVDDGKVVFDSIRGEPESSFQVVKKLWKVHQERKIVEISDERFTYLSEDGKSESKWTRGKEE